MIKARMNNNFLIVTKNDKKYRCWFPNWYNIDKVYLKELQDNNKSLLLIESIGTDETHHTTIDNYNLMVNWDNDTHRAKISRKAIVNYIENNIDL